MGCAVGKVARVVDFAVDGEWSSADRLAISTLAAGQYLLQRRNDAETLIEEGITNQRYVQVVRSPNGGLLVGDKWCASPLCAAAVIIAKWW